MARNVEIKARIQDMEALAALAARISDTAPTQIVQDDTFFHCPTGRLKLRTFADGEGELIYYRRADQRGPKESFYVRSSTATPETLREALAHAYGISGRVRKRRILFMVGRTRIHLDTVESLGTFAELEVVLTDGENVADAMAEARRIMAQLEIGQSDLVEGAYVDLIATKAAS